MKMKRVMVPYQKNEKSHGVCKFLRSKIVLSDGILKRGQTYVNF